MLELEKGMIIRFNDISNSSWRGVICKVIEVDGVVASVEALSPSPTGYFKVGQIGKLFGTRTNSASLVPLDNV